MSGRCDECGEASCALACCDCRALGTSESRDIAFRESVAQALTRSFGGEVGQSVGRALRHTRDVLKAITERAEAAERELERWRHGNTIEGDFVCPNELRAVNAERVAEAALVFMPQYERDMNDENAWPLREALAAYKESKG